MSKLGYLIISILIVIALIVIFFISYILNKKTPKPLGDTKTDHCLSCSNTMCSHSMCPENYTNEKETKKC